MNSPDDAVDAHDEVVDAIVAIDAIDVEDGLFSFLMHLVVICSSISHIIARLLVGSVVFEAVAFCAHFCSWYHKLFRASYPFPQCGHSNAFFDHSAVNGLCVHFFS